MSWSARLWFAAFFAAVHLGMLGCAGSQWPTVRGEADQQFVAHRHVRTVDVLPLDVQVWTHGNNASGPQHIATQFHATMSGAITTELSRRGYLAVAQMDWGGNYVAPSGEVRQAATQDEIDATMYSLSGYGYAVHASKQGLLIPYLPHRLGARTGSDATLYVGGWAYVGDEKRGSTGAKVAKGVGIGLLALVVVVVAIAGLKKGGGGVAKAAGGIGRAAASAGKVAVKAATTAGRMVGRASGPLLRGAARNAPRIARATLRLADAFGRAHTHVDVHVGRPNYYEQRVTPKAGRSRMYLEMTLIDNVTGAPLWHARETFPANASWTDHVNEAVSRMLSTLPAG